MSVPDATEMAAQVRRGEVSPTELVDEAIARVERLDPQLNAVIHERFDAARAEAAADLPDGPFRGVPFLVKDLGCAIAGEPHHQGNALLKSIGYRAPEDSFLYRRFRAMGLVTLGRTNTPEFGSTVTTEPVAYGPARNPWNTDHSTGGSSGGSGAAVAAGLVPMAHANDGGGSIRIPASENGLVGLKPTRGRVSHGPEAGEGWAGSTIDGVVSRSVRDSAAALDGINGREVGDPYNAVPPARPFLEEVGADPGRLRVGLCPGLPDGSTEAECMAGVEVAGRLLESLGHKVEVAHPAAMFDDELGAHFLTVLSASSAAEFDALAKLAGRPLTEDDVEPTNWFFAERGRAVSAPDYIAAVNGFHAWQRRLAAWWEDEGGFDVLVTPTMSTPPPPIGWLSDPDEGPGRVAHLVAFTSQFNVSGQPAVSLPLHMSESGLPIGIQFVGPYGDESMLIRLASQLEDAAPWAGRTPAVWAG